MNEVRKYNNVTKSIPFLFLFLFLTLSGCGNQSINSNKETNVPEITLFRVSKRLNNGMLSENCRYLLKF